jgi:multidrug efflux system outer membrane protein
MKKSFLSLIFLSGCAVQPPYEAPELDIPCEWHTCSELPQESNTCFTWWEKFNDPVLNQLMELAAEQNLDIKIAAMRVLEARAEANGKTGDLYPHVDGSFNCGHVGLHKKALQDILVSKSCQGKSNFNFFELGFDAEWELDFFGMTAHEIAALKAHEEAVLEDLSAVWVTLSAEIAKNYMELRSLQQRQELFLAKIDNQKNELLLNQELKSRGILNDRELSSIQSRSSTLKAELPEIQYNIEKSIHRLSTLLGYYPGDLFDLLICATPLPELPCNPPVGLPSELLQRRPDIRKAERNLASATERVGSAIAALFPRISLWGFVGEINSRAGSLFRPSSFSWAAGPQVVIPIFNSKLLLQDVEYNKLATQEALYTYQKTVLEALEEAENAIAAYTKGTERLIYLNEAYATMRQAEVNEEQLYANGLSSRLTVITLSKQAQDIKEQLIQAELEQRMRYITIYKALGGEFNGI